MRTWWSLLDNLEVYGLYFYILFSKHSVLHPSCDAPLPLSLIAGLSFLILQITIQRLKKHVGLAVGRLCVPCVQVLMIQALLGHEAHQAMLQGM